ncbi:hypothetical protein EJB05_55060 [Eragrostis curvula]|uniref:Uncharacterized protein n=1 Tax=Eragrostis curvula TaxID=38414 RepID=A0A5J9SKQ2_9POAL|nr:hypothetical protein EJB05_55060 [Eragrostis curvula]
MFKKREDPVVGEQPILSQSTCTVFTSTSLELSTPKFGDLSDLSGDHRLVSYDEVVHQHVPTDHKICALLQLLVR